MKSCKLLFKNKNFWVILTYVTCILGFFNLYGTILNELLTRYDYTEKETSLIGGAANFIALFGVYLISILIDKYKRYKLSFIIFVCLPNQVTLSDSIINYFEKLWTRSNNI